MKPRGLEKAKDVGFPHELWTTRLLARHAQDHAPAAGHACLARIAQRTVCKILAGQEVRPPKVRYYLARRDPAFETKLAEVLYVYQEIAILRAAESGAAKAVDKTAGKIAAKAAPNVAFISCDEKPGIQAIANTAADLPPAANEHPCGARDHEYKRHGTLSLLAGFDLRTLQVHACLEDRHRSRAFIGFLKKLDVAYPADTAIKVIRDNHSAHVPKETNKWLAEQRDGRFTFVFTPSTAPGLDPLRRSSLSKAASRRWHARSCAASGWPRKPNSSRESWPALTTSTVSPLSTPGPTGSPCRRDRSRSMEAPY